MRTTVNLHDGLLETVKLRAREQHRTLGEVVEDALRHYLLFVDRPVEAGPPLPVFKGGTGMAPGIDPRSNASLYEAMYAEEDAAIASKIGGQ